MLIRVLRRAAVARLGTGQVLYLKGSPYEQGEQLGRGAADLIVENVREARLLRARVTGELDLASYESMTRRNEAWVRREFPELLDELHGVAQGSGVDYADLLHLNLNTDIAYARAYALVLDCTQVLATGAATANGKTYIGKTRDLTQGPHRHVLLHREYDDGSFRNEFQVAGQMTLPVGINGHGVAMTTSGQWSDRVVVDLARADSAWHILNLQPVFRHARSAAEALQMIRAQPRVAGMQVMLADQHTALALEITDSEVHVFEPEDGILVRTNHFLAPELQRLAPTFSENRGTFDRFARARELAVQRRGTIGMQDVLRILSDHSDPPVESICRHDGAGRTYAATVDCPQEQTMWTAFGNPCEGIQAVGRPGE
jgi:isopenicillin-N N-acyltransferase-like protein